MQQYDQLYIGGRWVDPHGAEDDERRDQDGDNASPLWSVDRSVRLLQRRAQRRIWSLLHVCDHGCSY